MLTGDRLLFLSFLVLKRLDFDKVFTVKCQGVAQNLMHSIGHNFSQHVNINLLWRHRTYQFAEDSGPQQGHFPRIVHTHSRCYFPKLTKQQSIHRTSMQQTAVDWVEREQLGRNHVPYMKYLPREGRCPLFLQAIFTRWRPISLNLLQAPNRRTQLTLHLPQSGIGISIRQSSLQNEWKQRSMARGCHFDRGGSQQAPLLGWRQF